MDKEVLRIKNLVVHYETNDGVSEAVNNISLSVNACETIGLVGETGAGKTTIALSIMGLLPKPAGHIVQGEILLDGENILDYSEKQMRKIRGGKIGMIFQDPMSALNPVISIGTQITEVVTLHNRVSKAEATAKAMEMLKMVGIQPERFDDYPHEFSGGMKQRVVIAMALSCNPHLLLADEPTTALDVTIQAQVLELMKDLMTKFNTALLMITHDLGVVAEICNKCAVVYAGEIIEFGTVDQIFNNPKHPYTLALFGALPNLDEDVNRLKSISGLMTDPMDLPSYCSFYERCDRRCDKCMQCDPEITTVEPGHIVKCLLFSELGLESYELVPGGASK